MKKHAPELAALHAYILTQPKGQSARFAQLAYAFFRGVPFLAAEPTPFSVDPAGGVTPSTRRTYPAFGINSRQNGMLVACIQKSAHSFGGLVANPIEIRRWLGADPTPRILKQQSTLYKRMKDGHHARIVARRKLRAEAFQALVFLQTLQTNLRGNEP